MTSTFSNNIPEFNKVDSDDHIGELEDKKDYNYTEVPD
jgi:hypothetical protein